MTTLHVFQSELERIGGWTSVHQRVETGGSLYGYWTHSGAPVVALSTGPGAGARHEVAAFYQDVAFMSATQASVWEGYALQHLGEWHSHHRIGLAEPSAGDIATVWSGMASRGWSRFVLGIANLGTAEVDVTLGLYLFDATDRRVTPCEVRVMRSANPFRDRAPDFGQDPAVEVPRRGVYARVRHEAVEEAQVARLRPLAHVAGWSGTPAGRKRLGQDVAALRVLEEAYGCTTSVRLADEEVHIEAVSPSGNALCMILGEGYPQRAPRATLDGEIVPTAWSPDRLAAEVAVEMLGLGSKTSEDGEGEHVG